MRGTLRAALALMLSAGPVAMLAAPVAADEWERSFEPSGPPQVVVTSDDGNVEIKTHDGPGVRVHVETDGWSIGPHGVFADARQSGNRVEVEVRTPHWDWGFHFGHRHLRVTIDMPHNGDLEVHSGDGGVEVEPLKGHVRVQTGDGGIAASGLSGDVYLHTGDGGIRAADLDGTVEAHSGDGSVVLSGRFEKLEATSGDGGMRVLVKPGSKMTDGWLLRTGDGGLSLALPSDLAADLDVRAGDGAISFDFPVEVTGSMSRHSLHGTMNGGGPALVVRSGDGSIRISELKATAAAR